MNPDNIGQLPEIIAQAMLIRNIRFDIPSVRRDRDEPVLPVIPKEVHIGEHRCRIFRAEADHIHYSRVKAVAADLIRIIGIADTDKSLFQSVREPLGIESRNVRPLSGVDDHTATPFRAYNLTTIFPLVPPSL